ncbi:hypothetical protein SF12_06985 [Streptomyces sp. MBRL 601]|nr:hypothetical protein SF12_06985 [Streptomyces sp. MBRL 601]
MALLAVGGVDERGGGVGHVVGVEEDAAVADDPGDLAVERGERFAVQPVQGGGGEDRVVAVVREQRRPVGVLEVGGDEGDPVVPGEGASAMVSSAGSRSTPVLCAFGNLLRSRSVILPVPQARSSTRGSEPATASTMSSMTRKRSSRSGRYHSCCWSQLICQAAQSAPGVAPVCTAPASAVPAGAVSASVIRTPP